MADLLGRRRVFMAGLVLFALASLAGGLATNSGQLIAARAVQGLGAAILSPAALSIVTTTFRDGAERNKALGVWGAVAGSGGAAGVLLGGVLTDGLGWEWVLWVNVPIGLIAALVAPALIAESRSEGDRRHFDFAGAASITAGLSLLVYALVDANSAGWGSAQTIVLLAASAALIVAFVLTERRSAASPRAVPDLPAAHAHGRQRGGPAGRRLAVLDVLLHLPVHAAGAGLQRDQGGRLLPAAGGLDHPVGRNRVAARDEGRLQERPGDRDGADRGRPCLVLPDLGPRQLRGRHPRPVAARRGRARLRVRADDDRRGVRGERPRRRPGERPDQHLAAGRRRARARNPVRDLDLGDRIVALACGC